LTLAAIAILGGVNSASAHDFWIEPSQYVAGVPSSVTLALRVGENFSGQGVPRRGTTILRFVSSGPKGLIDVPGLEGRDPAGFLRVDQPGDYVVGYETKGQAIELEAGKFESYLREEGLERVIESRRASGQSDRPGREIFVRCAKVLVRAGGGEAGSGSNQAGGSPELGLTLELLLEADPRAGGVEDAVPVRLLFQGEPVEGVLVVGLRRGSTESPISARTDADGRVELPIGAGEWLLKAVHMVPAQQERNADWKSYWASLTFSADSDVR
jgi:hypothetical protein